MSRAKHADIFAHLRTACAAIDATDGYNLTVAKVLDHPPLTTELDPLPLIAVVARDDQSRALPCNLLAHTAVFELHGYVDAPFGSEAFDRAGLLLADMRRAVMIDPTCAGAAIDTFVQRSRSAPADDAGVVQVTLHLVVRYHEQV
ncbi:MAG TPA: hypothetical protein PKW95_14565 [bacterium]|nr:hypothetical protein [bacterium]